MTTDSSALLGRCYYYLFICDSFMDTFLLNRLDSIVSRKDGKDWKIG